MRSRLVVSWVSGGLGFLLATGAFANGVFQSVTGDVKAIAGSAAPETVIAAQRFQSGTTVKTGPGSGAILRFDDGHAILLHENTEIRVSDFRFNRDRPRDDKFELQLIAGALRSVTGLIGQRSRDAVLLSLPQANIGIRGTDFMVVLINPAYLSVTQGVIAVSNAAGTVAFSAGALGTVAANGSLAAPVTVSALPAAVSAAFRALGSVSLGSAGGAGTGGASSGFSGSGLAPSRGVIGTLVGFGVGVAAVAAAGKRNALTATEH